MLERDELKIALTSEVWQGHFDYAAFIFDKSLQSRE